MSSNSDAGRALLQFGALHTQVDFGFWHRLAALKLDTLRLDDSPLPIEGFYAPCSHEKISKHMMLLAESLPAYSNVQPLPFGTSHGNRNKCPAPGTLINVNNLKSFRETLSQDLESLLKAEAQKIFEDIWLGRVEENPALLSRFLVLSYSDLKKWTFHYRCAFPALVLDPPATLHEMHPASEVFSTKEASSLSAACKEWRDSNETTDVPFFLVSISADSFVRLRPLKEIEACQHNGEKLFFGFYDPCHLPNNPGWPLRNFLAFISLRCNMERIHFFCYREKRGVMDLKMSLVGEVLVSVLHDWKRPDFAPRAVGWESGGTRSVNLSGSMDPKRLAISAAELNLKLMRWRMLPSLDLNLLSRTRCLLLGAGTLGSQVARLLMAWGVRKITVLGSENDSGEFKGSTAAAYLQTIFPSVEVEGIEMEIRTPGMSIHEDGRTKILENCKLLKSLVASHDVIFLLTDAPDSRWLPSLFCATENKLAITVTLRDESFFVMRHGARPLHDLARDASMISERDEGAQQQLGCCFCDAISTGVPDSLPDTQHIVTPIASAYAVEMLVGILHHPEGLNAPGEITSSITSSMDQPLGILPHQIRGSDSGKDLSTSTSYSSSSCIACSDSVVLEFQQRGLDFVIEKLDCRLCFDRQHQKIPTHLHPLPPVDLDTIARTKCLLLGAGTLGCEVARILAACGVHKITLLDSGRVSMSNPVRQSLYTFEDSLNGGQPKAPTAAALLRRLFPSVEAEGIQMVIPMPGHPVNRDAVDRVLEDCKHLQILISTHDVVFLLTDTRESRWLPTLFCAYENKIAITAALGFDSYLAMRHGAHPFPSSSDEGTIKYNPSMSEIGSTRRLGCYFCSDVVAPVDSISNRTLDQQCTVTRPGLAPIASALAVQLLFGILRHPKRIYAPCEAGNSEVGTVPHQMRGSLSQCALMNLFGYSSSSCTACSIPVLSEFRGRGTEFVLQAIEQSRYLEDLTGLTKLMESTAAFQLELDNSSDADDSAAGFAMV